MKKIDKIRKQIMADPENAEFTKKGWEPVFQAPSTAKILIASQAPGIKAQESNKTFHDVSGDLLRDWLGVDDETFYQSGLFGIVPMDYYFPGKAKQGDRPPRKKFASRWNPKVLSTMPELELKILVGAHAQKFYLGKDMKRNLTETVRNYKEYLPEYFPIVHPSPLTIGWQQKNPWFDQKVVPDLKNRINKILLSK
ncbi:MAG: uracil-DNA glycosylase family protein [Atopostipes sp.]|nr:uracil-DNA glycosylase family protein [Atopostipes sp.]